MSIRKAQDDVRQWRLHVGLSNGVVPEMPGQGRTQLHRALVSEESDELCEALHEAGHQCGGDGAPPRDEFLASIAKEAADTIFVVLGMCADLGIDLDPVWDEVCESNMTKTGEQDGSGKIVKGDNYVAPDIESIIRRQMRGAEV